MNRYKEGQIKYDIVIYWDLVKQPIVKIRSSADISLY